MSLTAWFMLTNLLVITAYDLWTWRVRGVQTTISQVLRAWGQQWGLFPYLVAFAMGALFYHFFLVP